MSCREIQDRLAEELEAARTEPEVSAHLARCPACRAQADRLARVDRALASLAKAGAEGPPAALVTRTLASVLAAPEPRPPRRRRPVLWAAVASGASAALFLLIAGFSLLAEKGAMLLASSANALAGNERPQVAQLEPGPETGRREGTRKLKDFSETTASLEREQSGELSDGKELDLRRGRYDETRLRLALLETGERLGGKQRLPSSELRLGNQPDAGDPDLEVKDHRGSRLDRPGEDGDDLPEADQGLLAAGDTPLDALTFLPAQGYFKNTYLPGDPELDWLREGLEEGLWLDGRRARLDTLARPYRQPFDPPARGGLALSLAADRLAVDGPTRLLLQVGLKGAVRPASRRSALEAVLLVDLRALPDEEARRALWTLADALGEARQAGDRFALVVAGGPTPRQLAPEAFSPASARRLLAEALLDLEAQGATAELGPALAQAYASLARPGSQDAPLGSQLVLLATAGALGEERAALEERAHQAARLGVSLSTLGVGAGASAEELAELALAGQGRRRLVASARAACPALDAELAAGGAVVARALRLRIRLSPGVRLVGVLGSAPLEAPAAARVREAEQAIDQQVARDLGLAADRGEDEDGIQVVIPAFYAGDEHVILLDVVAPGPGPLAEVRVRAKDLVGLENTVLTRRLDLAPGERAPDRLCLAVRKNALAFRLAEDLSAAGERLAAGDPDGARSRLRQARARAVRFAREHPSLARDEELLRDAELVAAYGLALDARPGVQAADPELLARSLLAAGKSKLAFARPR